MCNFSWCNEKRRSLSNSLKSQRISSELSSPSHMKTIDLTEVFKVPSKDHPTAESVIAMRGFQLGEVIGNGSFATVFRATRTRDNLPLACKRLQVLDSAKNANIAAKNELYIMERMSPHPHIITLYDHFVVDMGNTRHVYIIMQLAEGNSLSVYMRKVKCGLPEATCKRLFSQIVSAVNYMHSKGISHCDLKMGNILLDKNLTCLISDFGLSRVSFQSSRGGTQKSGRFCGTMNYMAPEILLTKDYEIKYNPFVADVWALGVILYCIVNRGYPFAEGPTMLQQQMRHRIQMGNKISFKPNQQLLDLFHRLLEPNVEYRIRMNNLIQHPWIKQEVDQIESAIEAAKSAKKASSDALSTSPSV